MADDDASDCSNNLARRSRAQRQQMAGGASSMVSGSNASLRTGSVGKASLQTYDSAWARNLSISSASPQQQGTTPSRSKQGSSGGRVAYRTPPRPPTSKQKQPQHPKSRSVDDFSLPPELSSTNNDNVQKKQEESFKSWLTAGILGSLGTVAGVTLSTTGQLMAPPLQMTKSVLLPGLLALFIDTLDSVTPPRVKDWFRILSSSVYHLFSVLSQTPNGRLVSKQFLVVLQDLVQVFSAPESRQVIVDGMATSVKLADALNTPETKQLLDQMSKLGCRLVDAAASGKTKQFMCDGKDLIWKGIETASDPATTLALAEVTAHLCHVLEDTSDYVGPFQQPGHRSIRNMQNRSTYLDPITMNTKQNHNMFGGQTISTEEVILSCLGIDDDDCHTEDLDSNDGRDVDDTRSVPSNVLLSLDPLSPDQNETNKNKIDLRCRTEAVNVDLLKDRILNKDGNNRQGGGTRSHPVGGNHGDVPVPSSALTSANNSVVLQASPRDTADKMVGDEGDLEDIHPDTDAVPRPPLDFGPARPPGQKSKQNRDEMPAVEQFYSALDDLLDEKRKQRLLQADDGESNNRNITVVGGTPKDSLEATIKKWKDGMTVVSKRRATNIRRTQARNKFQDFSRTQKTLLLLTAALIGVVFMSFSGFAIYGMYSAWNTYGNSPSFLKRKMVGSNNSPSRDDGGRRNYDATGSPPEIVIRIVKEVVHVNPDGSTIDVSSSSSYQNQQPPDSISQDEIQKVAECVQSSFQDTTDDDATSNHGQKSRRRTG